MTDKLTEVVNVECTRCGLISNDMTGWDSCYNEDFDNYYYLCPECAKE